MFKFFKKQKNLIDLELISGSHDTLIAGPFLGEFGWELMEWQGYLRNLSKFYEKTIIYGRESSKYLYKDFVSEFRRVNPSSWENDAYELRGFDYKKWAEQFKNVDLLIADNRCKNLRGLINQDFISFGNKIKKSFDIVIHARNIYGSNYPNKKDLRNWPKENWDELCESLKNFKIASVGLKELSYAPKNSVDLRGISTKTLCNILFSSKCCVGPSSGLMHLASLCKVPHIVWTTSKGFKSFGGSPFRYLRSWNPLNTKVKLILDYDWNPPVNIVRNSLLELLNESKK